MVIVKTSRAVGSFLGRGTHVWLEVYSADHQKIIFSGAKAGRLLGVVENLKKDYRKPSTRGDVVVPPPAGLTEQEWAREVIIAGRRVVRTMSRQMRYCGCLPNGRSRANCCTVVNVIIEEAGGVIPYFKIRGVAPGLHMVRESWWADYRFFFSKVDIRAMMSNISCLLAR